MPRYLSVAAVRTIHDEALRAHGGAPGVRSAALLESSVAAPQASFAGEPLLSSLVEIAAAYLFYLCRNHPFVDGNKRTALAACLVFLEANGRPVQIPSEARAVDAWESLVLDVAAARIDRKKTTVRLRRLLGPARKRHASG